MGPKTWKPMNRSKDKGDKRKWFGYMQTLSKLCKTLKWKYMEEKHVPDCQMGIRGTCQAREKGERSRKMQQT